jgi:hypothetical protein
MSNENENAISRIVCDGTTARAVGVNFDGDDKAIIEEAWSNYFGSFDWVRTRDGISSSYAGEKGDADAQWHRTGKGAKFDWYFYDENILVDGKDKNPALLQKGYDYIDLLGAGDESSCNSLVSKIMENGYPVLFVWRENGRLHIQSIDVLKYILKYIEEGGQGRTLFVSTYTNKKSKNKTYRLRIKFYSQSAFEHASSDVYKLHKTNVALQRATVKKCIAHLL